MCEVFLVKRSAPLRIICTKYCTSLHPKLNSTLPSRLIVYLCLYLTKHTRTAGSYRGKSALFVARSTEQIHGLRFLRLVLGKVVATWQPRKLASHTIRTCVCLPIATRETLQRRRQWHDRARNKDMRQSTCKRGECGCPHPRLCPASFRH